MQSECVTDLGADSSSARRWPMAFIRLPDRLAARRTLPAGSKRKTQPDAQRAIKALSSGCDLRVQCATTADLFG